MLNLGLVNPGHSLVTLYLIVAGNFLAPLFGCRLQYFIESNFVARHYIGFLTMLLFVRLTSDTKSSFKNILVSSLIMYMWFVATTRVNFGTWILIITLASALFFIHYYESSEKDPDYKKTALDEHLPKIKEWLIISMALITMVGVIVYAGEKRLEYGKKFNWQTFLIGVTPCKHKTPEFTLEEKLIAFAK